MEISAQKVSHRELSDIRTVLLSEGLPVETVLSAPITFFQLVTDTGARIGWGGLEIYDNQAVLRSVVIRSALRKTGAGSILVKALIQEAKNVGLKKIWLLTNNAENFFEKLGFRHALRTDAPKAIQSCEEFTWPHHDVAHCMNMKV